MLGIGYAEMETKVAPCGELGAYLVRQTVEFNATHERGAREYRSLGDSPCVGLMMNPKGGRWAMRAAPLFAPDMTYVPAPDNRPIRIYDTVDTRFILEDFFAKLHAFHRAQEEGTECWTAVGPLRGAERGGHGAGCPSGDSAVVARLEASSAAESGSASSSRSTERNQGPRPRGHPGG